MHYSAKHSLAIACRPSIYLSVMFMDQDHRSESWKLIAWTISPTPSLFIALLPEEHGEISGRLKILQRRPCCTWL